ncbi:retrovirus-related Pol polyprotein from transposon 17.6 [Trichonephila clavipes]|nr:retrovirus-related Pol polyprotein from transposon 17.6 [Trichonephila clavipes]
MEEIVEKVSAAPYVTVMDLSKGYFQIPLTPRAQRYAPFVTPFGTYIPKKMMFGLVCAPYYFCKLMAQVLERRSPQNVSAVHRSIAIDVMPTLGIVSLRHGVTLNSRQAASPLLCVGGWETEMGDPCSPTGFSLSKLWWNRAKSYCRLHGAQS